jgi:toxin ParE1/3/4
MKTRFTPSARTQFLAAVTYINRENPSAAREFYHKATELLKQLHPFPLSGRVVPEFPDLPFREIIVPPYRFFYRQKDTTIWIVAVWHSTQLPVKPDSQ